MTSKLVDLDNKKVGKENGFRKHITVQIFIYGI